VTKPNTTQSTAAAGTFEIGGDLPVNRLGYGAMRITGRGIWGEPGDPDEARAAPATGGPTGAPSTSGRPSRAACSG
jgi:hypothetical protein